MRGGGVVLGIMMIALGLALTAASYASAKPGGTYVIFVGLMIGGFVMFMRGAMAPDGGSGSSGGSRWRSYESRARPARTPAEDYVAPPGMMPAGYCWACGRKVRPGNTICYACGAAQVLAPPPVERTDAQEPEMPYGYGYGSSYSGSPYPDASSPGGPYPGGPYPGGSFRGGQYPGGANQGRQYPGGPPRERQRPRGRYPR